MMMLRAQKPQKMTAIGLLEFHSETLKWASAEFADSDLWKINLVISRCWKLSIHATQFMFPFTSNLKNWRRFLKVVLGFVELKFKYDG